MDIRNPWNQRGSPVGEFYKVPDEPVRTVGLLKFYKLPASVLVVDQRGEAISETVTVDGFLRMDKAALAEPWKISAGHYQSLRGVHQPWIAEISPFQVAQMGKQEKARYEKKRSAEWAASGQCKNEYRDAVVGAYDAGMFQPEDPDVSEDAAKAVRYALQDRATADLAARMAAAHKQNRPGIEDVQIGDRVFSILGSFYGTVTKKSKKSVRVKPEKAVPGIRDDWKVDMPGGVQWLHYNELKAAVEAGQPIGPAREPWSVRHAREEREAMERRYRCRGCKRDGQGRGFYTTHFAECPNPPPGDAPEMEVLA